MASDHGNGNMKRVLIALTLTGIFMVVEVIGGILAGSLALLADAGHMLTDTMALALAAVAFHVSKRPADARRTFGYQRFQILAAFVNGLSLLVIVGWILFEAMRRFISPVEVTGTTMLVVAGAGLIVNVIAFAVLHSGQSQHPRRRVARSRRPARIRGGNRRRDRDHLHRLDGDRSTAVGRSGLSDPQECVGAGAAERARPAGRCSRKSSNASPRCRRYTTCMSGA
jgi:cation diffusion facilitator family transporter